MNTYLVSITTKETGNNEDKLKLLDNETTREYDITPHPPTK